MTIPSYHEMYAPILTLLTDGEVHSYRTAMDAMAQHFRLSDMEISATLPKGGNVLYDRISWAVLYLKKAGMITQPKRGAFCISDAGRALLKEAHPHINNKLLAEKSIAFGAFTKRAKEVSLSYAEKERDIPPRDIPPEEAIAEAFAQLNEVLISELMQLMQSASWQFFEHLVLKVMVAMGYGGSFNEAHQVVGRSGDGGIDGIIKEDILGMDMIYLQAKKWDQTVGRETVQSFVGALAVKQSKKGILISTSDFSKGARDYAASLKETRIVLIDGRQLAQYMIDHNVGVTESTNYILKKIDSDFFE